MLADSRVGEEARAEDTRSSLAKALYQPKRWEEAESVFRALSAEHPGSIHSANNILKEVAMTEDVPVGLFVLARLCAGSLRFRIPRRQAVSQSAVF